MFEREEAEAAGRGAAESGGAADASRDATAANRDATAAGGESLDAIAGDLQRLRLQAGNVSYAEIAGRIARRREARGLNAAASRIARSTVYDAFRTGRRRINPDLVAEIVTALGHDEATAEPIRARDVIVRS